MAAHEMRTMNDKNGLAGDTRGAVLVVGVVMAAVLVGILWHLLGVGDAIVYRERMQEAADATAFDSAIWHARTMNLLVVLNVVMSAILAVLVIWRAIEMVLEIAAIILFLLGLVPFMEWAETAAIQVERFVLEKMVPKDIKTISPNVTKWLQRVNKAEKMVSTWAPYINVASPTAVNTGFFGGGPVQAAFPVSLSLIPPAAEGALPERAGVEKRFNMGDAFAAMPVQEDSYDELCKHAALFVPNTARAALDKMGAPSAVGTAIEHLGNGFASLVADSAAFFCTPAKQPPGADEQKKGIEDACKKKDDQFERNDPDTHKRLGLVCKDGSLSPTCLCDGRFVDGNLVDDHRGCCSWHGGIKPDPATGGKMCAEPDAGGPPKFDERECEGLEKDEADKKKQQIPEGNDSKSEKPVKVWSEAKNGNVFLQAWSFVKGSPNSSFDSGVAVANHGDAGPAPHGASTEFGLAEAEYFNDSGENMWNLGWHARLRRVHDPISLYNAAPKLDAWGEKKVGDAIHKAFSGKPGVEKAMAIIEEALPWIDPGGEKFGTWWTEEELTKRAKKGVHDVVYGAGVDNYGSFVADQLLGPYHKKLIH
jgi:hypothetical protein